MKVAHVLGSLNIGGAEILELDLFANAKSASFDLIAIHRKKGALYDRFKQTGVPLFHARPKNKFDLFYLCRLRQLLAKENIDIAHCHQTIDALLVWLAVFGLRTKVVLTIHSNGYQTGRLKRILQYLLFRQLDRVLFVSKFSRSVYIKRLSLKESERYGILYNAIDFNKFTIAKNAGIRKELNLAKQTLLMGTVGNFTSGRDHLTICKFLKKLSDEKVQFHFIFVGKESAQAREYFQVCKQYCVKNDLLGNVTFAGSRGDVPAILLELDLFIYASEHDTFGIAVVEAMYAGLPVFVNDWPVMFEITKGGKYATVFESKNASDLLSKIKEYMNNSDIFEEKAGDAVEYTVKYYSIKAHINRLEKYYNKL